MTIDPTYILSNYIEAGLWITIGVGCGVAAVLKSNNRRGDLIAATLLFLAFGLSDIVETRTGAWWRPGWLFGWQAICVMGFAVLLLRHYRTKRVPPTDSRDELKA